MTKLKNLTVILNNDTIDSGSSPLFWMTLDKLEQINQFGSEKTTNFLKTKQEN